jgi:flagellar basal-body rod protein FlgB
MKLFDSTKIPVLGKALNAYALRQRVISSNLANITTVGYRSRAVAFDAEMSSVLGEGSVTPVATDDRHLTGSGSISGEDQPAVIDAGASGLAPDDALASGVNNVDVDHEMAEMAKNSIRYRFATKMLGAAFNAIEKSIKGSA